MQPPKKHPRRTVSRRTVTLGKGTSYSTKTQPVSARPSTASKLRAAKKTTSSGKGAGKTPTVDSRAQRAKVSTAKVTSSESRPSGGTAKVTSSASRDAGPSKADAKQWQKYNQSAKTSGTGWKGAPGTRDAQKNAQPTGARNPASQVAANKMNRALTLAKQARDTAAAATKMAKTGKAGVVGAVAASGLTSRNTADGTLKGKPTGPQKGPSAPERLKKENPYKEGTFNHAFKAARNSNYKTFTWNGKKYTTDVK
jgi:hypothetical protein